jgi:hypothetical protein
VSDPILDAEAGVESNQPRELFDIVQNAAVTYRITSGTRDIVYNGNTYIAYPTARTELRLDAVEGEVQQTFALPLSHGLCQRWTAQATPPQRVAITITRLQSGIAMAEPLCVGVITSMALERHLGRFQITRDASRTKDRKLPRLTASKVCPHILYDRNCKVDRNFFCAVTTVTGIDGRRVIVGSLAPFTSDPTFFLFGEFLHNATGERQTIITQTGGNVLTLSLPMPDLAIGDTVQLYAGCSHDLTTACGPKFLNRDNFGGVSLMPDGTVFFLRTGYGVVEQV